MKKAVLAFVLLFLLAAGQIPVSAAVTTPAPSLAVIGGKSYVIRGGREDAIQVTIMNNGGKDAENVNMTVFSGTLYQASVQDSNVTIKQGESYAFTINLKAEDAAATHTLELTMVCTSGGQSYPFTDTLSVRSTSETPATPAPGMPNITMLEPSGLVSIEAGKDKIVDVVVYNNSQNYASKFLATIAPNESLSAVFIDKTNDISTFSSKSQKTIKVKISVPKDLAAGSYLMKIPYTYVGAGNTELSGSASFYVRVSSGASAEKPHLIVDNYSAPATVKAGEAFTVAADIVSMSSASAKNVQAALSGLSSDGLMVSNAAASQYLQTIGGGARKGFSFAMQSSQDLPTGAYPFKVILTYTDDAGVAGTAEYTYFVNIVNDNVASSASKAVIEISAVAEPSGTYEVGQQIPVKLTLKNTGLAAAGNIKVTAATDASIVPSSSNTRQIRTLEQGASSDVTFSFMANASSKTQNYTIGFTIEYETGVATAGVKEKESFTQYVGVNVSNPDNKDQVTTKSIPKIIISKYSVDPATVAAGKEFNLNIAFQNTHSKKAISNIKVSFAVNGTETEKGNVFTPVESSNMFYIEQMEPKGISEHTLRLFTVQDAKPKNYVISIRFEYEDEEGTPYDSTVEVGINVKQETKLDVGEISLPQSINMGDMFNINFIVHNTGKVTLSNLKVRIEGEGFETAGTEYIFGNFTSGSHDYYDAMLSAKMPGQQSGRIVISFDDDMGEHKEIVNDFTIDVMEAMSFNPGMDGKYPEGMIDPNMGITPQDDSFFGKIISFTLKFWYLFAIGTVVIFTVVFLLIRRHVKKAKQKRLDELDE